MSINKKVVDTVGLKWSLFTPSRGSVQIRFRWARRQVSISTGEKSEKALSKAAQAKLIREYIQTAPEPERSNPTFKGEVARFVSLKYEGKKPKTVSEVVQGLERLQMILGVSRVEEVTKAACEAKKDVLRGSMAPATWRGFISRSAKFFRWQVTEGNLKSDPLVNFHRPQKKEMGRREDMWEPERFEAVLGLLSGEEREMLLIFRETAMDPSDLFHFDPKKHLVKAFTPDGKPFWKISKVRQKAKSGVERIDQPLSSKAAEVLLPRRESWFDFSRYSDAASFGCAIRKKLHAAQERAGFSPTFGIKALRHTFATYHSRRYLEGRGGPPMEVLRQWLGHAPSSRVLESVYMHTNSSGLYQE